MPKDGRSIDVADATHGLQLLVAIADSGSFTAAGARLGLTPSAVSKAVTRVESRLGVRLLQRTTRRVSFTDAGEMYVARGRQLISDFEGLEREMSSRDDIVRGTLRVSAPMVYGSVKVAPLLVALARKHPALDVQLKCEDRLVDMVIERIDVAVRILSTLPAEFVACPLTEDRRGLYASPAYLRVARTPKTLDDLASHSVITYSGGASIPRRGRVVFATDSILAAREAALGGLGIAELPDYLARDDAAAGALREVLPGAVPTTRKIYALYLSSRYLPPQVRALVDLLVRDAKSSIR
ncbi:LysR family transcriptional regulator [Pendulispora brunnea]|uniref:LysR family transcriptional regulator n=1 Tax=Pendulispora brunnea TaxID=2905690 RepID=A0ABZ2JUF6_9BACT